MSLSIRAAALAVAAFLAVVGGASAHSVTVGSLELTDLWTRATPPGAPTASGYLTITNTGAEADRLVAASSPMAGTGQLHQMEVKDGIASMHPVDGIAIPAGGSVTLAPMGFHLMFVDLKGQVKEGEQLPVTLTFEKAGTVETFLHVMAVGASGPAGDHDHAAGN